MSAYITVTGYKHYFGLLPFAPDISFTLRKEPDNAYDEKAIAVYSDKYGKVGYVAQSADTKAHGTLSAYGIYDCFADTANVVVRFIAGEYVIAEMTE